MQHGTGPSRHVSVLRHLVGRLPSRKRGKRDCFTYYVRLLSDRIRRPSSSIYPILSQNFPSMHPPADPTHQHSSSNNWVFHPLPLPVLPTRMMEMETPNRNYGTAKHRAPGSRRSLRALKFSLVRSFMHGARVRERACVCVCVCVCAV